MESKECKDVYENMLIMLKEYENLVYPNFNSVNKIIQSFFDTFERESKKLEPGEGKDNNIKDMEERLKDTLYGSDAGVKAQLEEFYKNFIKSKIEPVDITNFNRVYGADLTEEFIITMRKKHANRELRMYNSPENLRLRNIFASHPECRMIDTTVSYEEMKKIKRRVNAEITRDTRLKNGINAPVSLINYSDPFMNGIERGIICYNTLMSPALQRVCQQLINSHPFVTFSDKSLAVGINYPIKTVMLLGNIGGDSKNPEKINNTLAHQACGRAGRRGLDSEGFIIYVGVDISEILIPKYTVVGKNDQSKMQLLIPENTTSNFKNYMLNDIKPLQPEPIWKCKNIIDIDKLAEEMYRLQSIPDDPESEYNLPTIYKTIEEIKAELVLRINSPVKEIKVISSNTISNTINITKDISSEINISDEPVKLQVYDSWDDDVNSNLETSFM